jgi:hypothetical protein
MTVAEMELKRHEAWLEYCKATERNPNDNTLYFIWMSAWNEALIACGEWAF